MKIKDKSELVDFVVIGAMKAGTSTLYQTLLSHPEINLTKSKEANFFNAPINDSRIAWYKQQFNKEEDVLKGDISPNYSKRQDFISTAKQIAEYAPSAKIIYVVRDPISRLLSHIHHDQLRGRIKRNLSIVDVVLNNPRYVETSKYYWQLQPYMEIFNEENILIVSFEELIENPKFLIEKILLFIGVRDVYSFRELQPSNLTEKRYYIYGYDKAEKLLLNNKRLQKIYHLFWFILNIKIPKPFLDDKVGKIIFKLIKEDVDFFHKKHPEITKYWSKKYWEGK